jgi:nicotinamide riboside kinase
MNIALTGAHSTGKTTLFNEFVKRNNRFRIASITETARIVIEKGFPMAKDATVDSYINYVNEQLKAELSARKDNYDVLISDRTILDAVAYSQINKRLTDDPFIPPYVIEMLESVWLMEKEFYDFYIYCPVEFPLIFDGVRDEDGVYQRMVGDHLKDLLERHNVKHFEVSGSMTARYDYLMTLIYSHLL